MHLNQAVSIDYSRLSHHQLTNTIHLTMKINLAPGAPFVMRWKSGPLARSNDMLVLNGFVNTNYRLRPEPIRFVRLDSGHAQSDGKSMNRGLLVLDLARGRDQCRWPKGLQPLGTRLHEDEFRSDCQNVSHQQQLF